MNTTDDLMREVYANRDQLGRENGYDTRRILEALEQSADERRRRRARIHAELEAGKYTKYLSDLHSP